MAEDKLEIELDVNTKLAKEKLEKLAASATDIKINLKVNKDAITRLSNYLAKAKSQLKNEDYLSNPDIQQQLSQMRKLISENARYQSILRSIRSEQNRILKFDNIDVSGLQRTNGALQKLGSSLSNAKNSMNSFNEASSRVSSTSQKISRNIFNTSSYVDYFSRRIYGLLRNAFIFNLIRRGFKDVSDTLFNLIKRDTQFARSLLIVKANLIRAFAPIWQVVLPWIRALGRALVWLSNRLIGFINYLAGREIIKPIKEVKEAQKVVSDFMKIASPKKDMFDIKKPEKTKKRVKKIKDETKKATKESNKLLASFDKLETLKFKKNGLAKDPFGLEELKKKNGDIKDLKLSNIYQDEDLKLDVDEEDIETQIARAINQIQEPPLEFNVNDDIGSQITSQVNNLDLPTLDFKVADNNKAFDDLKLKLNLIKDAIIGIGTAAVVYKVASVLGNIITLGTTMIGPAGWLAIAVGLGTALAFAFKDMNQYLKDADGNLTPFGKSVENVMKQVQPLHDALKEWQEKFLPELGKTLQDIGKDFEDFFGRNPELLKDISTVLGFILKLLGIGANISFKIVREELKLVLGIVEGIYKAIKGVFEFITQIPNRIGQVFGALGGALSGVLNKGYLPGLLMPSVFKGKIPGLAQGSVLKGGDPFLAYLNDQPRGQTNIEAPLDTMVTAFKQALSEGGYGGPTTVNLEATGSMSELIRMLNIKISEEKIRVGNSFVAGY